MNSRKNLKNTSFILFLGLCLIFIGLFCYVYYGLIHSPIGPPDSFINTSECTIQKNKSDEKLNNIFTANCVTQAYFIASSEEDLNKYIGKKVHIQAVYPRNKSNTDSVQTNKQCITGNCQSIFKDGSSVYAIAIQKIEELSFAKVMRVIDGDTIVIDTGEHVRYIGINTPEIETNECYASAASQINKDLVLGKTIKLEKDVSETDKYGRLLRYVYVGDTFVDDYLVKNGDAKVMIVPPDVKYKDEFLQLQNYAKENNLGLWGKCP